MTDHAFRLSIEELNYLGVAVLVTAAAFLAFRHTWGLETAGFYLAVSSLILGMREFGQRTVAQWMDAEVTLNLSVEGASVTVLGAIFAVVTRTPVILPFPVYNSFSLESYEHWGKSIDAMWMKREAWIVYGGIAGLGLGWIGSFLLGFPRAAEAFSLFTLFQLLPLDHESVPTGRLDGAVVLMQNGFFWLIAFGLTILSFLPV